jgi:hypothetical protein
MMERHRELYVERQWELYRRSVVERMPDSEYKSAVLAGIEHHLTRLDSIEASPSGRAKGAVRTRTDKSIGA